jgi:transcriptional regulator with XRE-family HTH domain
MTLAEALSIRITELLTERNMTAYRLSQLSGVSETTIGDLKKQRNVAVNLRIIYELTQGLGIDLAEFFNSPLFKGDNIID